MSFASAYIEKRALFPQLIDEAPDQNTRIIVIVPSYAETQITKLFNSLQAAHKPECIVEVHVIVNAPENAAEENILQNSKTLTEIESWKSENRSCWFRLFSCYVQPGAVPGWGVGLARKTGMDEAARRFNSIEQSEGLIVNLDADCTVRENYFTSLYKEFYRDNRKMACSIYFEHEVAGREYDKRVYRNIALYELHLRYLLQAQKYAGFPWAFHTVGSSMAVRASEYVAAGGMNRKQAGEDFYFIQKLVDSGNYFSLNSTAVYPSPRTSFRVPFGTGAAMGKMQEDSDAEYFTYNIQAFDDLRILFSGLDKTFSSHTGTAEFYNSLPESIRTFVSESEWLDKLTEIQQNTSGLPSFRKRFFVWFNMFRIVRYLNSVHPGQFPKISVNKAAAALLKRIGVDSDSVSVSELLEIYRALERKS